MRYMGLRSGGDGMIYLSLHPVRLLELRNTVQKKNPTDALTAH